MTGNESAQAIERRAAEWVARADRGLDADAIAQLEDWLAADPRRRGALLKAEATWMLLDRGSVLSGPARANLLTESSKSRRVSRYVAAGLAASVVLVALAVTMWPRFLGETYRSGIGEVRRLSLSDGSVAQINTASRLVVTMAQARRVVALEEGEAWFQVAQDAARPFTVEVGEVRVQALGTAFSVRRLSGSAEVTVAEGSVQAWVVGDEPHKLRLDGGQQAVVGAGIAPAAALRTAAEIERGLAWRSGEIGLQGETLAAAAAEFNRYNTRKIVIDDPSLAREPLVGWFRTREPEGFAHAVASSLHARVRIDGERIRIEPASGR